MCGDRRAAQGTDRGFFENILTSCFFESPAVSTESSRLKGQLAAARVADGFEPVPEDNYSREIDPVGLVRYAQHVWDRDRWPGKNGRIGYAQRVYDVFILRQLAHLSLRIWDEGDHMASKRLQDVQRVLDRLNETGSVPLIRDCAMAATDCARSAHETPETVLCDCRPSDRVAHGSRSSRDSQSGRRARRRPHALAASTPLVANRLGIRRSASHRSDTSLQFDGHGAAHPRSGFLAGGVQRSMRKA